MDGLALGGNIILNGIDDFDDIYSSVMPKSWMLVVDKSFNFLPDKIKNIYSKYKNNCIVFDAFTVNPNYEDVKNGVKLFNDNNCSLIVAIGGGSTIDVSKCIKLFSMLDCSVNYLEQKDKYENKNDIFLIALPTTAGTGSESTRHAVIYYDGIKQSISSTRIIPDYIIIEPDVLRTLPLRQKRATMLDALCQACESWWNVNATDESKYYSKKAISLIINNWEKYGVKGIFNDDIAMAMLKAANFSGRAINITATTAAHAMSYKLSSLYGLPHGIAVAICFPIVWEHMFNKEKKELNDIFLEISKEFNKESVESAISFFKEILIKFQIEYPKSDDKERDVKLLAGSVNIERMANNPIKFDIKEIKDMYMEIVK